MARQCGGIGLPLENSSDLIIMPTPVKATTTSDFSKTAMDRWMDICKARRRVQCMSACGHLGHLPPDRPSCQRANTNGTNEQGNKRRKSVQKQRPPRKPRRPCEDGLCTTAEFVPDERLLLLRDRGQASNGTTLLSVLPIGDSIASWTPTSSW